MWSNPESIAKAQAKLLRFKPPFCSNPCCLWHHPQNITVKQPFIRYGIKKIGRYPYVSQRFRCLKCRKTFSASFFSLVYWDRKPDTYEEIHTELLNGYSGRALARRLKISEDTVRRRKKKLARWALLAWAKDLEGLKLNESVAFDGLENFSYSQYDINNVNHAVGRESLYVYDFNLSPMNRKGKMSHRQKRKRKRLEEEHGRYDPKAIEKDARRIFERLLARSDGTLLLHTDNHKAYRRALRQIRGQNRIAHFTTSSKVARNYRNRLFAINHTDMLTRHHTGNFKRETIAFAKHTVAMLETFCLFATHKNYLRPRFWKVHKRDPLAHKESPAMHLGLRDKIETFSEFYRTRISVHHVNMPEEWQNLFDSTDLSCRRTIRPHGGI